jgi:hypothetical protein
LDEISELPLFRVLIETAGDGVRGFRSIWMLLARDQPCSKNLRLRVPVRP